MVDIINDYVINRDKICYITPFYKIENKRYFSIVFDGGHKIEFCENNANREMIVELFSNYR
jgi:hypothetical protein